MGLYMVSCNMFNVNWVGKNSSLTTIIGVTILFFSRLAGVARFVNIYQTNVACHPKST